LSKKIILHLNRKIFDNEIFTKTMDERKIVIMLQGLHGFDRDAVKVLYLRVDCSTINDPITDQTILPVLRMIYSKIFLDRKFFRFEDDKKLQVNIFERINVQQLTEELKIFNTAFLPVAEEYLTHLDVQAEMTALFCDNYVHRALANYYAELAIEEEKK